MKFGENLGEEEGPDVVDAPEHVQVPLDVHLQVMSI